jgi:cell division protein FtsB
MPATGQPRQGENGSSRKKEISLLQSRGLPLLLVFFLFILVLAFVFGDRGIVEIVKTKKQIKALQQTIHSLELKRQKLAQEIEQLQENPMALEKKARESLWLMKKNEKVVVFVAKPKEAGRE